MNLKLKSALISVTAVIAVFLSVGAYAAEGAEDKDVTAGGTLIAEDVSGITDEDDLTKRFNEITRREQY